MVYDECVRKQGIRMKEAKELVRTAEDMKIGGMQARKKTQESLQLFKAREGKNWLEFDTRQRRVGESYCTSSSNIMG